MQEWERSLLFCWSYVLSHNGCGRQSLMLSALDYTCTTAWFPFAPPMSAVYLKLRTREREQKNWCTLQLSTLYPLVHCWSSDGRYQQIPNAVIFVTNLLIAALCCTSVMSASNYAGDMIELDRISGVGRPADVINPPHLYITYCSCQQNYTVQIKERTLIHWSGTRERMF